MNPRIRILALVLTLAALIGFPLGAAQAQSGTHLSQMTIRMWPEFDKPGVLVFLIGQTAGDVPLPAKLKFTLPQGSSVNAVAYLDSTNNVLSDKIEHTIDGQTVTMTSPNGNFHIEFYDPALTVNQQQRSYKFTWQQDFTIDQLMWEIEQPAGGANLKVDPAGGTTTTDQNGLMVYQFSQSSVAAGQVAAVSVTYDKSTTTLSAEAIATGSAQATPAPTQASTGGGGITPTVIAGIVLILVIAAIAIMYVRGGFPGIGIQLAEPAPEEHERKPRGRAAKKVAKKPEPGRRFCPQCGEPAQPGDMFCRNCGTKLHG